MHDPETISTLEQMRYEAADLVKRLGWSIKDACRLVGIPPQASLPTDERRLPYTPTPSEIAATASGIKSGEIIVGRHSTKRWAAIEGAGGCSEDDRAFDLAGLIDEDRCQSPEWFLW
ncbi:hypothetical protein U8335_11355 [Roseiconus lacunae]|uniref:hypothetical protein n=1 Tax=Roseiconus lacunae TaxID=2605694 RepID=UPI00308F09F6|nr:hypothetical protein U8335_11355 [Stieleria sp. HD01]